MFLTAFANSGRRIRNREVEKASGHPPRKVAAKDLGLPSLVSMLTQSHRRELLDVVNNPLV